MKFTAILILGAATALKLNNEASAQVEDNRYNDYFNDANDQLVKAKDDFVGEVHEYLDLHEVDIEQAKEHALKVVESVAEKIHEHLDDSDDQEADALTQISDVKTKVAVEGVKYWAKQSIPSNSEQDVELAQYDLEKELVSTFEEQVISEEEINESIQNLGDDIEQDVTDSVEEAQDTVEDFFDGFAQVSDVKTEVAKQGVKRQVKQSLPSGDDDELAQVSDVKTEVAKQGVKRQVKQSLPSDDDEELALISDVKTEVAKQGVKRQVKQSLPSGDDDELAQVSDVKTEVAKQGVKRQVKQSVPSGDQDEEDEHDSEDDDEESEHDSEDEDDEEEEDQDLPELAQVDDIQKQVAKQGIKYQVNSLSNDEDESAEDLEQELAQTKTMLTQLQDNVQNVLEQIARSQYQLYLY